MTPKHLLILLILLAGFLKAFTWQENVDTVRLGEVVITASHPGLQERSPVPMQQIHSQDIGTISGASAAEALKNFGGVTIKDYSGIGGLKTVMVRSLGASHTSVMLDGVPQNDAATGQIGRKLGDTGNDLKTYGSKLYVANSVGLDFPDYDNTVSVIDFTSMEEIKKIAVGSNPYTMETDSRGFVYVISRGNYDDEKMYLQVIDSETDELVHTFIDFQALSFSLNEDRAYVYHFNFMGGSGSSILVLDLESREVLSESFISDGTEIETVYGIKADSFTGNVYIADARGFSATGKVYCFDNDGRKKYSFYAGLNPGKMAVYYTQNVY